MIDLLMTLIETRLFEMNLTVLSGFSSVLNVLSADKTVEDIVLELRASTESREKIAARIHTLLVEFNTPERRYDDDSIITTYLYALYQVDPDRACHLAEKIVESDRLFWARRMAQHILAEMQRIPR